MERNNVTVSQLPIRVSTVKKLSDTVHHFHRTKKQTTEGACGSRAENAIYLLAKWCATFTDGGQRLRQSYPISSVLMQI
eukprot:5690625-Ditylum_brightwellii.AAC.1